MKKEQTGNALSIVSNLYHYYRPPSTTSTYSTLDLSSRMLCRLASVREYRKKEKNTHKKKVLFFVVVRIVLLYIRLLLGWLYDCRFP